MSVFFDDTTVSLSAPHTIFEQFNLRLRAPAARTDRQPVAISAALIMHVDAWPELRRRSHHAAIRGMRELSGRIERGDRNLQKQRFP
jgi:hypothetical protein